MLLVQTIRQRPVVVARCERARAAGVGVGMSVADARALLKTGVVRIEQARPDRDALALVSLARWAVRFSPCVAADPSDGLLLNVTGCTHLFGGEQRLVGKVARSVKRLGLICRVALAPTYSAAWAMSRFGSERMSITDTGSLRAVLSQLPVRSLRIEPDVVHALGEVGITRIGELFALPRATIPSRFGHDLLLRMDQAMGQAIETIEPIRPIEPPRVERVLDGPTTSIEVLGLVVRGLLDALTVDLEHRSAGVRRLDATFDRTDLGPITLTLLLGRPTREVRHLWRLLRPRLERMHLGFGVDRVELLAARWARLRDEQLSHLSGQGEFAHGEESRALIELCDTIANRIGADRVCRARLIDTHIPELVCVRVPAMAWRPQPIPHHLPDRPSLLLRPPEPIRVLTVAEKATPAQLTWRGADYPIVSGVGPERIGRAWWDVSGSPLPPSSGHERARDYFKVQDERGRWLWVFHELDSSRWFIHGLWA